jgi:hypothetical protein
LVAYVVIAGATLKAFGPWLLLGITLVLLLCASVFLVIARVRGRRTSATR